MKNIIKLIACLILGFNIVRADHGPVTPMGHFQLPKDDLIGCTRTFTNNTKKHLMAHYRIADVDSEKYFAQDVVLKRGHKVTIDFGKGILSLPDSCQRVSINLGLSEIVQLPTEGSGYLKLKRIKPERMAFEIYLKKFRQYKNFTLSANQNNLLTCKAH